MIIFALVGVVSPALILKLFELEFLPAMDEREWSFLADPSGNADNGVADTGVWADPDPFEDELVDTPVVKAEVGVEVAELPELNLPTNQEGVQPLSPVLSLIT